MLPVIPAAAPHSTSEAPTEVIRSTEWFEQLLKPLQELNAEYTTEFFWTRNWRHSIQEAAERYVCDTILLCESSAEHKRLITDSKWDLVRHSRCDVVICDEGTSGPYNCVLAAEHDPQLDHRCTYSLATPHTSSAMTLVDTSNRILEIHS